MANANPISTHVAPTQIADAPDPAFRAPIFEINPTAGPVRPHPAPAAPHTNSHAPAVCAPAPASVGSSPLEVHEPAPGQHVDVTVTPSQAIDLRFQSARCASGAAWR